jgi:RNA polymerase sigma factor (sigma-70 family)
MSQASAAPAGRGASYEVTRLVSNSSEHARWFTEEIQPHEPALRAYLRGRFPTLRDVDDQIQDTYARLFRARESGRKHLTRGYLFTVARNAAVDLFRRSRAVSFVSWSEFDSLSVAEDNPSTADLLERERKIESLEAAVNALPERCREIFVLRRLHKLSHQEIARRLGISENTVNAQLVIGMMRCRQFLIPPAGKNASRHDRV